MSGIDELETQICHPIRHKNTKSATLNNLVVEAAIKKNKKPQKKEYVTPLQIYQVDLISQTLQQSLQLIPPFISRSIIKRIRLAEDQAYLGILGDDRYYLQRLYHADDDHNFFKMAVTELVEDLTQKISDEILNEDHQVRHKIRVTKDQILSGKSPTKFRQLKQRLKQNLNNLKSDLQFDVQKVNLISGMHPKQFAADSSKTKQAQQFIKKIKQEQQTNQRKKKQRQKQKQQIQAKLLEQKILFEQQIKKEQQEQKKRKLQILQQLHKKQQQQRKKRNQEYKQYISQYQKLNKPLFKKKQQEFYKNVILEQNKKKLDILMKIKQQRKPIDTQQINQHKRRYLDYKQQQKYQWEEKNQIINRQIKKKKKKYYHGKFYSLIVKGQNQNHSHSSQQIQRQQLVRRQQEYSTEIKQKFRPKRNLNKQKQIQSLIESMKWSQKHKQKSLSTNAKKQGIRNLERLHQLITQCKVKGKIKAQTPLIIQSTKPQYTNYLHENKKQQTFRHSKTINYDDLIKSNDLGWVHMKANQMEENAKRKQLYLKNMRQEGVNDVGKFLEEKSKVDENYLNSARAKIAMLNQFL